MSYAPMAGLPTVEVDAWTGQLGREPTPTAYVGHLVHVFRLVRRVMRDDATLWLNLGDSFNSGSQNNHGKGGALEHRHLAPKKGWAGSKKHLADLKHKDLIGIPWRVALALQADGWWLRSEIIWAKGLSFCESYAGSVMPESVRDRVTRAHEQVFMLTKKARYYFDHIAVKERLMDEERILREAAKGMSNNIGSGWKLDASRNDVGKGMPNSQHGSRLKLIEQGGRNLRSVWAINPEAKKSGEQTVRQIPVLADAVSYDTRRKASEGCRVHALLDRLHPMAVHDARAVYVDCHITGSGDHPARVHLADYVSTELIPSLYSAEERISLLHAGALSARLRSNQSRKKALAPSTSAPDTFFGKTLSDTERTEASPPSASTHKSNGESKTSQAVSVERGDGKSSGNSYTDKERLAYLHRVLSACTCSFYTELAETSSHYASWPSRLVAPMIKAGTSERGVCPACLAPYERVLEKVKGEPASSKGSSFSIGKTAAHQQGRASEQERTASIKTIGWIPTCGHGHPEPIPATVLDPFSGTGTTADVARRLGRHAILIDRSGAYVEMQREALAQHELF